MIKRPLCVLCLIFLVIQSIIFIARGGQSYIEEPASSIYQLKEGQELTVTGQVYCKKQSSKTQILYLTNNLIIYDSKFTNIKIGQSITIKGTLHHFDKARNPGNFDQSFYYAKEEIFGFIFSEQIWNITGKGDPLKENLFQIKQRWKSLLVEALGEEHGQVMSAMLLGEKSEMDAELKEQYQKNGIGHVLAISGLHISFIGLGLYQLIRKSGIPFVIAGILSLTILTLYGIMIGFSISVFRAYLMLCLKIGADITGRVYDMLTALMLSAAVTIWRQPLYLDDAGFYLSYGAVLGIILISPILKKWERGKWFQLLIPGICVNAALLPIQLWYYYEIPTYSLLLNIIVVPMMSVLLSAGMLGSVVSIFALKLGENILKISQFILIFYDGLSERGLNLPMARIVCGQPAIWKVILYYVTLFLIIRNGSDWKRVAIYLGCCLVLMVQRTSGLEVTMLDVGQGDGIFIRGPENVTCFIDGGSSDVKEVGKNRIEPFLKYKGVGKLDYVFISHGDEDHYIGIREMIERQDLGIRIKNLVVPENYKKDNNLLNLIELAKEANINVSVMKAGSSIKVGELEITCFQPTKTQSSGNASSMVLELSYNKFHMLCTGDTEKEGEDLLLKHVQGKEYTVLKAAHHGSKYSTSEALLNAIDVKMAWISSGRNNSYGHPHEETIERLQKEGCKIYGTAESGAITIRTNGYFIDNFATYI